MIWTEEFENFDKAPPEKQHAVRDAGFVCFGKDGYQKTAMSEIAVMAGVSKAALFHYFGTKREFYRYLFRFSCDEIAKQMTSGTDDFFECILLGIEAKMRIMAVYSGMAEYLLSVVRETDTKLLGELSAYNSGKAKAATDMLFSGVDWNKLKTEVDMRTACELVSYVSNGYLNQHAGEPPEEIAANIKKMLNLLKRAIYKEEYL